MFQAGFFFLPLLCDAVLLASGSESSDAKDKEAKALLKPNASSHLNWISVDPSVFHGPHPAFPYLLPGTTSPMQAQTKSMFNRKCFRFIYAATINITSNDNPAFFHNLFNLQCALGDKEKCSHWSDELLQAVRKKLGVVKLLGKDGHVGRPKKHKHGTSEEFEAHLPPTLTGLTSYANWCNELYKDLATVNNVTQAATTKTTEAMTVKASDQAQVKSTNDVNTKPVNAATAKVNKVVEKTGISKVTPTASSTVKKAEESVVPADAPVLPDEANEQERDGCFCFHRGTKKICHCDEPKKQGSTKPTLDLKKVEKSSTSSPHHDDARLDLKKVESPSTSSPHHNNVVKLKESDEPSPFKGTESRLKGLNIADQASKTSTNDKDMDNVETLMRKARIAAENRAHKKKEKKGNLKKKS